VSQGFDGNVQVVQCELGGYNSCVAPCRLPIDVLSLLFTPRTSSPRALPMQLRAACLEDSFRPQMSERFLGVESFVIGSSRVGYEATFFGVTLGRDK
jgi:hypothetical protein